LALTDVQILLGEVTKTVTGQLLATREVPAVVKCAAFQFQGDDLGQSFGFLDVIRGCCADFLPAQLTFVAKIHTDGFAAYLVAIRHEKLPPDAMNRTYKAWRVPGWIDVLALQPV